MKSDTFCEYVKVCPTYGPGYFYLPGSDVCVKVTPRVTFDYLATTAVKRATAVTQPRTRAFIQADTRQSTEYGLVRVYTSLYGEFVGSGSAPDTLGGGANSAKNTVQADAAFVQFGGLTAGRYDPQIEEGWGYNYSQAGAVAVRNPVTDGPTNGVMYAASLGNGITALVSLEDQTNSRLTATANTGSMGTAAVGGAGLSVPDVIGKIKVDQAWGGAFLGAGMHENRGLYSGTTGDAKYGYAVKAGVKINLPMLAAGDNIGINVGYSDGFGAATYKGYNVADANISVGGFKVAAPDAVGDDPNKTTKAWSLGAGAQHYWTPTVYSTLFAHYANIDVYGQQNTFSIYSVGSMLAWTPVKGMVISGEAYWSKINLTANEKAGTATNLTVTKYSTRDDQWSGRIRVSRSF